MKKETLAEVFLCESRWIFISILFIEHQHTVSVIQKNQIHINKISKFLKNSGR